MGATPLHDRANRTLPLPRSIRLPFAGGHTTIRIGNDVSFFGKANIVSARTFDGPTLMPHGWRQHDLRAPLAALLGQPLEAVTNGRMTYHLRRLRLHGLIERLSACPAPIATR